MGSFSIHQISQSPRKNPKAEFHQATGGHPTYTFIDAIRMLGYQLIDSDAG